jgi:hypothetical protein
MRKYIGLLIVGFIMALGTVGSMFLLDILPIDSVPAFIGATLIFTVIYTGLGYILEFFLPEVKKCTNG